MTAKLDVCDSTGYHYSETAMFNPKIKVNATVSNEQVRKEFKCSLQGGMRRSLETNSLVLISDHYKSIYDDRWIDGVLHYTGTGQRG